MQRCKMVRYTKILGVMKIFGHDENAFNEKASSSPS